MPGQREWDLRDHSAGHLARWRFRTKACRCSARTAFACFGEPGSTLLGAFDSTVARSKSHAVAFVGSSSLGARNLDALAFHCLHSSDAREILALLCSVAPVHALRLEAGFFN